MTVQNNEKYTLEEYISQLGASFSETLGSIVVNGSLVRKEWPVSDVDIKIFGNKITQNSQYPKICIDKPISVKFVPTLDIESVFTNSMRYYPILLDGEIIKGEKTFINVFNKCKEKIRNENFLYYLLFTIEEEILQKEYINIYGFNFEDYFSLKRMQGSRRTIDRIAKTYRLISGNHFECKDTMEILKKAQTDSWLPQEIIDSTNCVYSFLESMNPNLRSKFIRSIKTIHNFFDLDISKRIRHHYAHRADKDYLCLIDNAKTRLKSEDICKIAINMPISPSKWLLLFVLAINKIASKNVLSSVYEATVGKEEYIHIVRALLKNLSFNIEMMKFEDVASDQTAQNLFRKRKSMIQTA